MLTFFRKIRRSLLDSGSARKYLLYAIGEIALVVVGILIALQINNWNEWKKERIRETKNLTELKANLKLNVKSFEDFVEWQSELIHNMETMIRYLDDNMVYHDSLETYAVGLFYLEQIALSTSTYETLKFQGIDIISSDSLRLKLVELHEKEYENLAIVIRDVSMAYFSDRSVPLKRKYGELRNMWSEDEFYYFLKDKIIWKTDMIIDVLDKIENTNILISDIEEELENR